MVLIGSLFKMAIGSFYGRMIGVALLALSALAVNNSYQRYVGGNARQAQIVENTNKKARERDEKIRKIRSSIKPADAWQRLRREYSDTD